jgi:transposase
MPDNDRDKLSSRQTKAISALITSRGIRQAASITGIGEATLYRWLRQPEFRSALIDAESLAVEQAARRITALSDEAVSVLEHAMAGETDEHTLALRLRAAQSVLEFLLKLRELVSIEERLARLEEQLK